MLPAAVLTERQLPALRTALHWIHDPLTYSQLNEARNRFVFEELFLFSLSISLARGALAQGSAPVLNGANLDAFYQALPFAFTSAQQRCAQEILGDLTNKAGRRWLVCSPAMWAAAKPW